MRVHHLLHGNMLAQSIRRKRISPASEANIMEIGLTELVLGVTAASFLPPALIVVALKLWPTKLARSR